MTVTKIQNFIGSPGTKKKNAVELMMSTAAAQ